MPDTAHVIRQARRTLPDLDALRDRLHSEPGTPAAPRVEEQREKLAQLGFESADDLELQEGEHDREARRLLDAGRRAVDKVHAEGEDAQLSPAEQVGLEAIILVFGRPALFVQQGRFGQPPPEWAVLERFRPQIERTIRSVGRIELAGGPMLGTGFLVAPDIVMTNRHVASIFTRRSLDGGWRFKAGMTPLIDYAEEHAEEDVVATPAEFRIIESIGLHQTQDVDLALLRVAAEHDGPLPDGWTTPEPLSLAGTAPDDIDEERDLYIVGYPARDNLGISAPDALLRIFANVFEVKRLQPGKLMEVSATRPVFAHDCSTLGGNSGSCVVDLETNRVLGLHFRGAYLQENLAVALWRVAGDPLLSGAGLNFV
jgi:glutamyl endopeptidase